MMMLDSELNTELPMQGPGKGELLIFFAQIKIWYNLTRKF